MGIASSGAMYATLPHDYVSLGDSPACGGFDYSRALRPRTVELRIPVREILK